MVSCAENFRTISGGLMSLGTAGFSGPAPSSQLVCAKAAAETAIIASSFILCFIAAVFLCVLSALCGDQLLPETRKEFRLASVAGGASISRALPGARSLNELSIQAVV